MTVRVLRLHCSLFSVDVRLVHYSGRWIASADTVDGPSLGLGDSAREALIQALDPFDSMADELLETAPRHLLFEPYPGADR
jgi:hypothetical protein